MKEEKDEMQNIPSKPVNKESFTRVNPLDLPNGDIQRAKEHGKANLLYKIETEKIKNSTQSLYYLF